MEWIVDVVLLLIAVAAVIGGWRRGLLVTAASLVGLAAGAWLATSAVPPVVEWAAANAGLNGTVQRMIVAAVALLLCLAIGVTVLTLIASLIRRAVGVLRIARGLDSIGGAVLGFATWAVAVWLVAGFLQTTAFPPAQQLTASSQVVSTLNRISPVPPSTVLGALGDALDTVGFPQVFADGVEVIQGTQAPDPSVPDAVNAASPSIVRVLSSAAQCSGGAEGTGWVVAEDRVITNAHVVAGSDQLVVQIGGVGEHKPATLVAFDPETDLAVLDVPGLGVAPLTLGTELAASDAAYVAGYPENGPYDIGAARIRQVLQATGLDIYSQNEVSREIYALRGIVRPGNSGGPLLDSAGQVVGVVFARSTTDAETGYALTLDQIAPMLQQVGSTTPVASGGCATR
ncbi:MarP family serine protease [Cnuibacter sp. UC19_7]|uniref:MarP family serine protease n=1 Tax=Cnuibacter sp. UC19_7 TaxID=3350166 RepID=UPI00366D9D13